MLQNASKYAQHHAGQPQLLIYVNEFPNGKQELVFEQPCIYQDGVSKFHRVTEREVSVCQSHKPQRFAK
ncbi:MAG: hypothetical protein K0R55_3591 [Sporomusa sp.]|nr:hypothetical protein [Sporomusa sp.]